MVFPTDFADYRRGIQNILSALRNTKAVSLPPALKGGN